MRRMSQSPSVENQTVDTIIVKQDPRLGVDVVTNYDDTPFIGGAYIAVTLLLFAITWLFVLRWRKNRAVTVIYHPTIRPASMA